MLVKSIAFVTHDRRHVTVNELVPGALEINWPLCDNKPPTHIVLSAPTHLEYDEGLVRKMAHEVVMRCEDTESLRVVGYGKLLDDYTNALLPMLR